MRGDIILLEDFHIEAAKKIVQHIFNEIKATKRRFIITIGGESGSGKSEMGKAVQDELEAEGLKAIVLGQDDYFVLPPQTNDTKRREDPGWLGPHVEVKMKNLEENITDALKGEKKISKPLVDYENNIILDEIVDLEGVDVLIVEGTYTSLLRNVDMRIFIDRNYEDTLSHRSKRDRGEEVGDPFIEGILEIEHKIIAGHKFLADIIITRDYDVIFPERVV